MEVRNVSSCAIKYMFNKCLIKNTSMYTIDNIYLKRLKVDFYGKTNQFYIFLVYSKISSTHYSQLHERFGAFKYLGNVSIE